MITVYYVFINQSFYGYYFGRNFHNNVMYNAFMSVDSFKVYSIQVEK